MTSPTKWLIAGLASAVLLVGAGALAAYWMRTSSQESYAAWAKGSAALVQESAAAQRAHDDSVLRLVASNITTARQHATTAAHHDTLVLADSTTVVALRDSLALLLSAADSLRHYPPIVAALDHQVGDLTVSASAWRSAFTEQAQATATAIALHGSDSLFRRQLLQHLDSTPKPPRPSLGSLVLPRPYARAEWGSSGFEVRVGACLGWCRP